MRFEFSEDQQELRQTVRGFLERHATPDVVRAAAEQGSGFAGSLWKRLVTEMELTSLAIDPALGGAGASFVEVGIALEELGRTLLPVPFLPTVVAAAALSEAADHHGAVPLLERIVAGAAATIALDAAHASATSRGGAITVSGTVPFVADGAHAEFALLATTLDNQPALLAVELAGPGAQLDAQPTLDQTRSLATLTLSSAPAACLTAPAAGAQAIARARDVLAVASAMESIGAAARCLELTLAYLHDRHQFGRPIGSFQALKHRCADLHVALEPARSTAYYATWTVTGAPDELAVVGPLAQLVAGDALLAISRESIQLHGGIGFTWEHDAHLFFKRAKSSELLCGGRRALRTLIGQRAGIV